MTEFISGTLEDLLLTNPSMSTLFTQYEYDEKERILNLLKGECLLIVNKNNVLLNVSSSEFEKDIIENRDENLERKDYV